MSILLMRLIDGAVGNHPTPWHKTLSLAPAPAEAESGSRNSMKPIFVSAIVLVFAACGGWWLLTPYVYLPQADRRFLQTSPTRNDLISRFGQPDEEIGKGEKFPMTGWQPLPDRAATHHAVSFVRRYGSKIYVFLDEGNRVETFVISSS